MSKAGIAIILSFVCCTAAVAVELNNGWNFLQPEPCAHRLYTSER